MKPNIKSKPLVVIQCYTDRQETLPLRKVENGTNNAVTNGYHAKRDSLDSTLTARDRQETLPLRKAENGSSDVIANGHHPKREATDGPPPPPPPMPAPNGQQNGKIKQTISQIQMINNSEQTNGSSLKKGTSHRDGSLKRTPTPDYNTQAESQMQVKNQRDERAELESLESYTLKNPSAVQPKPPSTYFMKAPNGTATMKKHVRPVSVTIGEYGSGGGVRRQPSKLEFLNGDKPDGCPPTDDLSNRLQSELALTLSRSNLRKKTETLNQIQTKVDSEDISDMASLDRNFHARYGNNILPLPPSVSIPKVSGVKHSARDITAKQ